MVRNAFGESLSGPARTVFYFSLYMAAVGLLLVLAPTLPLAIFGLPEAGVEWVRILGLLVLILGFYYQTLARHEVGAFFEASVRMRSAVPFVFVAFAWMGWVKPILILFGLGDLLGAIWTWSALRRAKTSPVRAGVARS
jgi:hypothetical protein